MIFLRAAVLLAIAFFALNAHAQQPRAMGYVPEPDELINAFAVSPRYRAFLPEAVDLSNRFPPPGDQGQQSSCVGWAVAYALRSYHEGQRQKWDFSRPEHVLSPAFVYNRLRRMRGEPTDCQQGTSIAQALELLKRDGAPTLAAFPYNDKDCFRAPDGGTLEIAAQHRIRDWRALRPNDLDDVKGQLAFGNPVVFGMNVSRSFERLPAGAVYDDTDSPRVGGHAMVLVGYNEQRQAFKVINSWGTKWADGGFGWVSYRALKQLSNDRLFVMELEQPTPVVVAPPVPPSPVAAPVVVAPPPPAPPAPEPQPTPPVAVVPPVVIVPPMLKPAEPLSRDKLQQRANDWSARVGCARLEASVSHDHTITVRGFIGAAQDLRKLEDDLRALPGAGKVISDVAVYPWPQCEVYLNFAEALKSGKQGQPELRAQLRGASGSTFRDQDSLSIEIITPSYPAYLYVTYLQANGEAANLYWPEGRFPKPIPPNSRFVLGGGGNQPTYRIGAPFGDEIVVVVASASPLFREEPAHTASDREFLTSFRKAFLVRPKDASGARVVSAVALPLRTGPKN